MTDNNVVGYYANYFKAWPAKLAGDKPTAAMLAGIHALNVRPGSKVALALAMYLRPTGGTNLQVIAAVGAQQLNVMRGLIEAGKVTKVAMPANDVGHTVYRIALKAAKPAKPAKVRAAKPVKPAVDAAADTPVDAS